MQTDDERKSALLLRYWFIPLVLAVLALAIMLAGEVLAESLRYQRESILGGGFWRLLSGHLVHLGWAHLWLNLAGLGLIWLLAGDAFTDTGWWLLIVFCALFIGFGLLLLNPQLQWYVGLSGILHGLLVAGLLAQLSTAGGGSVLLLLIVLALKLAWEQLFGSLPGSESGIGGNVVVDAHLYGAIGGAVGAALLLRLPGWRRRFVR